MPRIARVVAPGYPHHIIQRGNRRQQTFFSDEDYRAYLNLMSEWCRTCGVEIWFYCLMPNHTHLIAVPSTSDGLMKAIGETHRRYARMINFREGWRGYFWQGRFASYVMDDSYLLAATRYIALNPVRAKLAFAPEDYEWSSCNALIMGNNSKYANVKPLLEKKKDWKTFFHTPLSNIELESLRRHERTGRPLGSDNFITALEDLTGRFLRKKKPGPKGPRKQHN